MAMMFRETQMNKVIIPPDIEALATTAVNAAFDVHKELGPGLLESAYEAAFAHELGMKGVRRTVQDSGASIHAPRHS